MLIIMQEANIPQSFIIVSILKIIANILQKARQSHEINQERGVSVRLGIHGLELLVGEAERTRAIFHKILPVPRLSDMHCLTQIAKFELVERDDTIENRQKILHELIDSAIQEVCLGYLGEQKESFLESIKQEFNGKTFQVSQQMIWKNGQSSYENQLKNFQNLKNLVESKLEQIRSEQKSLIEQTTLYKIDSEPLSLREELEDDLRTVLTEIILEGLCWIKPKILARKEAGYVQA
jgi:magnesium chelatase subunit I